MKNDYVGCVKDSPWFDQGVGFLLDWLVEVKVEQKRKTARRGMAWKRTMKKWQHMWNEDMLADISRVASKIMDEIRKSHPQIGRYL